MRLRAYSIFDRKSLQYHPPFFQSTDGAATRVVADLANDLQTTIGRHPTDYVLFYIGDYDDQKGALIPVSPLCHVVDCVALVQGRDVPLPLAANGENQ